MSKSNLEILLDAILNGETANIKPQSRHEEYLLALINGETIDRSPQSRLEVYMKALTEIGISGGEGGEAVLEHLEVIKNGTYRPSGGVDGYKTVTVNVPDIPAVVQPLEVTENGTYTAPNGVDGFDTVEVNIDATKITIFPETELTESLYDSNYGYVVTLQPTPFTMTLGDNYYVKWDGVEHECVAKDGSAILPDTVFVGNDAVLGQPDSGEPFVIAVVQGLVAFVICLMDTAPTVHTLKIRTDVPGIVLQDKTITENGTYTADEGFDGLGEVTVEVAGSGGEDYFTALMNRTISECSSDVNEIPEYAFYRCNSLTSINFPNCTVIGDCAFASCSSITIASFPVCSKVGASGFSGCGSLQTAVFPECLQINHGAFSGCYNLTSINFPKCTKILGYAFTNCGALISLYFPECKTVGSSAFQYCGRVTTINFPVCTNISNSAFARMSVLENVSLPLCSIVGPGAFQSIPTLKTLSLPACVSMGGYVFTSCINLSTIYLMAPSVCTLPASSVFSSTGITNTKGSIFVPASLVDAYKTSTNWTYFSKRIFAGDQ